MVEDQRRRHAIAAAASRPIVADALRQIRAIAAKAERRFGIAPHTYDAEAIARHETQLLRGFDIPEDRKLQDLPPDADPLTQGIPVTGPTRSSPKRKASTREPLRTSDSPPVAAPPSEAGDDDDARDWTMETPDE